VPGAGGEAAVTPDGKDYQLSRALDLLRGIGLYEGRAQVNNRG
jgi:hypothetical protein